MVYLDTSFIAPLAIAEASSESVEAFLLRRKTELATSQWTRVELASLVSRRVRMGEFDMDQAEAVRAALDRLLSESFTMLTPTAADFTTAVELLAKPDTGLRAGDALHLAIARNHGAKTMYTLDRGLLKAGKLLKVPVSAGVRL
ncbi:MAG: type II toxin-antitoxin system VapC family toxin [Acidiferrobacterales bacterium]